MITNQQENIVTDEQTGADAPPTTDQPDAAPEADGLPKPDPEKLAAAVKQALEEQKAPVTQIQLAPCPCGVANVNLLIDLPQGSKVGRAGCSACGVWGVDFLAPRTQDQELVGKAAAKAWNEAPRA